MTPEQIARIVRDLTPADNEARYLAAAVRAAADLRPFRTTLTYSEDEPDLYTVIAQLASELEPANMAQGRADLELADRWLQPRNQSSDTGRRLMERPAQAEAAVTMNVAPTRVEKAAAAAAVLKGLAQSRPRDPKVNCPSDAATLYYTPQIDAAYFLGMAMGIRLGRILGGAAQ